MGWRQGDKPEHDGVHEHTRSGTVDWDGKARVVGNEHPTEKPVELFVRPIKKHTSVGDVVFEPFSGSGSQLIAAERTGRRCRAIEISRRSSTWRSAGGRRRRGRRRRWTATGARSTEVAVERRRRSC
jgi:hypothetical protein